MRSWIAPVVSLGLAAAGCGRASPPSCPDVADHVLRLFGEPADDYAREVSAVFATRCTQDAWPEAVRTCLRGTTSLLEPRGCKQQLTPTQIEALDRDLAAVETRAASATIPQACLHYESVLLQAERCESFPASARKELRERFDAFKATWPSVPDKRALEPTCSSAIPAVKLAAAGCPGVTKW